MRVLLVEPHKVAYETAIALTPFRERAVLRGEYPGEGERDYELVTPSPRHTSGKSEKNLTRLNLDLACLMLAKPK